MTANPIDLVGGLTSNANVIKSDLVAWAKTRVPQVFADVTELRNTNLAGQLLIFLKSNGGSYYLDTTDTTTADNGLTCIVSLDGKRFKPISALAAVSLLNGLNGAVTIAAGTGITVGVAGSTITVTNSAPAPVTPVAAGLPKVIARQKTPPGSPATDDRYIVIATATGAWAGHENQEAIWNGSAWTFTTPTNDDTRWVSSEDDLYYSTSGIYKPYLYSKNILYPEHFGAFGTDGSTEVDETLALRAWFAAGAGKELVGRPGRTYWWKDGTTGPEKNYVPSDCRIIGYGASLKPLTTATFNTTGLMLCDQTQVGVGPTRITIEGWRFPGNRVARIAAGSHPNSVGQQAAIYCVGTQRVRILNCEFDDLTGDAIYMGGNTSTGRLSAYFKIEGNQIQDAGRNGISFVGTVFGTVIGNKSFANTFGVGHSNISYCYDFEPDASTSGNSELIVSGNMGGDSQVGFGFNNNSWNTNITLSANRTYNNVTGTTPTGFFAATSPAALPASVVLTGCKDVGSTAGFSGCSSVGF